MADTRRATRKPTTAKKASTRDISKVQKSMQAESKSTSGRSYAARMNDLCLPHAYNHGAAWQDDDVEKVLSMIEKDEKTVTMALTVGRSFHSMNVMRYHAAFALRHREVFKRHL